MKYIIRQIFSTSIDIFFILISIYFSYFFRFDGSIPNNYLQQLFLYFLVLSIISVFFMYTFKLHHRIWEYVSIRELGILFSAVSISCLFSYLIVLLFFREIIPFSIFLLSSESILILTGGIRLARRLTRSIRLEKRKHLHKALIIGAGDCGTMVAKKLQSNEEKTMIPIGFIDDNPTKWKKELCGIPVFGNRDCIQDVVKKYEIDEIIISLPAAPKKEIIQIINICRKSEARVKIIPKIDDLIHGKSLITNMRDVELEDLLGREPVKVDLAEIASYIENKTILVTGSGGSIGSELCRQIAVFQPKKLLLLGHGENSIYTIEMELKSLFPNMSIQPVIADIQDKKRIEMVFKEYRPEVVFHAAAHKHVPLMEVNPSEAIKNNVFGTRIVAEAADQYESEIFVLISSDKAVNPTSVMGVTKRIAEIFIQDLNETSHTKFVAVRFGNVLGSRGSVIPRFKEQIKNGGPVTITHPEMIRYFMTIPEAVQLVIQAGTLARGGEVFILDMGKPVRIIDLAEELIRLSGFEPYAEIPITFIGMREGEKLYEELLTSEEGITSTMHDRIFIGMPTNISRIKFLYCLDKLEQVIEEDKETIQIILNKIVPTYQHQNAKEKEIYG